MTNEELAAKIQQGETHLMGELWENLQRLVVWKAQQVPEPVRRRGGAEIEDLGQRGYFALEGALRTFRPGEGTVANWFLYYLKTAFAITLGSYTARQNSDPLRWAVTMDAPLDEEDGNTLHDLIADERGSLAYESAEKSVYREQLHRALESVLERITPPAAAVIRRRYWNGETQKQIAADGVSPQRISQMEENALHQLQQPALLCELERFVDRNTPYYRHIGLAEYRSTGLSATEKLCIYREKLRKERATYDSKRMAQPVSGTERKSLVSDGEAGNAGDDGTVESRT